MKRFASGCVSPKAFFCVLLLLNLLGLPFAASAQTAAEGQIAGVVQDTTGAVIPGARVVVRNVATDVERVLTTDGGGRYRATTLQPGDYEVTAERSGFGTVRRTGIRVEVGSTTTVNITLEVATVAEVVTVTEAAPVIDRESTEFTKTVNETAVANLPVNGRRFDRFVLLAPTVTPDGDFGLISYRGISGLYNNNTIDGADNNQAFFSEARGRTRTVYSISQSSIKEFQVGVNNFSAEFGRTAGGTVNAVTKSGGNAIHGEGFYFIRDDAFNAEEPFNKAEGFEQLPERRQQFGFSVGGPFIRDKLFWFLNYDQQIRSFPGVSVNEGTERISAAEPGTDPEADCDIPAVPGRCDAARALLLSQIGPFSRKGHNNVALGKVDWIPNDQHRILGQYNFHKWRSPNGIQTQDRTNDSLRANGFDGVRTDFGLARWQWLASPNMINEFRFQAGRDFEFEFGNTSGPSIEHNREIDVDDGQREFLPRFAFPNEKRFQFVDNLTYIRGRHTIKTGFDINYVRETQINIFTGNGEFDYRTFEAFARDVPLPGLPPDPDGSNTGRHYRDFVQAFDRTGGNGKIFFTTTDWNFYVQDTFKVRPDLTLNYGLRYEFSDLPEVNRDLLTGPLVTPEFLSLPPEIQERVGQINSDTNNFGPRLGIAWDVGGRQKLVVRAGYGLTYGRTSNSALSAGLFESNAVTRFSIRLLPGDSAAPAFPDTFCNPPLGTPGVESVCVPPAGISGGTTLNLFSEDYVRPLIHMFEANVEYALGSDTSISASYVGARGLRLPAFVDINLPAPSGTVLYQDTAGNLLGGPFPFFAGERPIAPSAFDEIIQSESTVNSWYNGFVLRVKRRLNHGLQFDSHFTVAKALDDAQSSTTFFAFFSQRVDPTDRKREYGRSNFDIRKRWVTHFFWNPPFQNITNEGLRKAFEGFIFSGILTFQDGRAFGGDLDFFDRGGGRVSSFTPNGSGADDRVPWLGRNTFTTTGLATVDFRVTREIRLTENTKAVFVWEAFNLFNRTNFTRFESDQFDTVGTSSSGSVNIVKVEPILVQGQPVFLVPQAASNTLIGPREMQFALKFIF